ncbi:ice-binding family protein [Subtercola sp. RTI3]|uniref:ice-binding family protein n=1 Tax=Subtercola sp. RTI3 TaxID=3048639 RepID=UPI002B2277A5|nr:ice-binding family protein [Subtercola sp. RTI3]MEA9983868.1 ice-binding family protein [Subtercola sp. RTI3]
MYPTRRAVLIGAAWSVPVISLAVATPASAASGGVSQLSLASSSPKLQGMPSGGGTAPLIVSFAEVGGAPTTGPASVWVTRLNGANGYPTVTDELVNGTNPDWTVSSSPTHHVLTYTAIIPANADSTGFTGTWNVMSAAPTSGFSTATLVGNDVGTSTSTGSTDSSTAATNEVTIPFSITNTVNLGTARAYALIGQLALTDDGTSTFDGAIGFDPGAALTGFSPAAQTQYGTESQNSQATRDAHAAFASAQSMTATHALPGQLGAAVITPGVWHSVAALGLTGNLTFDGGGQSNAVFILQCDAAITTAAASTMSLVNGARAANIFWAIGAATTLGAGSLFIGTALIGAALTVGSASRIEGRMLTPNAAVTLASSTITVPR